MDHDRLVAPSETAIRVVEIVAAYILVALFAIGVVDLLIQILEAVFASFRPGGSPGIADPRCR